MPGDFSGYLRKANGELKETLECLQGSHRADCLLEDCDTTERRTPSPTNIQSEWTLEP